MARGLFRQPPHPKQRHGLNPALQEPGDCYFDTVIADAPIAYWRLGEPSGATATDEMGSYDGTYTNGPTYGAGGALTGDTNTAVTFPDGVAPGTYVVVPGLVVPASAFTLEAWVKGAFSNGDSGVLGRQTGTGALLYVNSVTYVELDISGVQVQYNTAGDPSPINNGQWHHLVGTWDGANGRVYLDGALVAGPTAVASFTAAGAFIIGNYGNDPPSQGPFDGSIDEPAVYDYALTPAQILAHYNARSVECPPISFDAQLDLLGYVGHYKLGEASGSVIDRSGTANHGTVNNDNGTIVRDVTGGLGNGQDDGAMGIRGFGHVDIPHNAVLNIGDSFTFGFGFKRTSGGGNSAAVWNKGSGSDDIYIYFASTDQLRLAQTASGASVVSIDNTNPKLTDNAWHFVVVTKSGATAKWYIDGVDATNSGTNVTFADNSDAVFLGSAFDSTDRFNGDLDEFFIADTAYTQQNVTDLYDSWLNGVPDTGGAGYNRTAADAPTTSDAASRVLTLARTTADTRTTSDAASRTLALARSASDTRTTSDAATRVVGFVRSAADTRTTSDAASRTLTLARSAADAASLSDSVVQGGTRSRTAADTRTTSDAATRVLGLARSAADTRTTSDASTRTLTLARSTSDTRTTSDAAARVLTLARTAADTRTTSDSATQLTAHYRTATDGLAEERMFSATPSGFTSGTYTLGNEFTVDADGVITHLRWYHDGHTGADSHAQSLWDSGGTKVATVTDAHGPNTPAGYRETLLATPYAVSAGQTYRVSTHHPGTTWSYSAGPPPADGAAHLTANTTTGYYAAGAESYPNTAFPDHYHNDVVFRIGGPALADSATQTGTRPRTAVDTRTTSDVANRTLVLARSAGSYYSEVLADAPVAYWRMGELSGLPQDSAGTNHATVVGGTPTYGVAGAVAGNTAITFAAGFSVPDHPSLDMGDGPISVEFWAKRAATLGTVQVIWWKGGQGDVYFNTDDTLVFGNTTTAAARTSVSTTDTNWHHYVVSRTGTGSGNTKIYKDGVDVTVDITPGTTLASNTQVTALGYYPAVGFYYVGSLDELAVYNIALTPTQVVAHYNAATLQPDIQTSDAAIRVIGLTRSTSDAVSTNDSASRLINDISAAQDSRATSDTATRTGTFNRTAADTRTTSDVASRSIGLFRSATDTRTTSDAATRTLTLARTTTDAPTLSDAATQQGSRARSATDAPTLSDAAVQAGSRPRTAADTRTTSDAASRTLTLVRSAVDTRTTSDSASRQLVLVRSATDARITSDAATRTTTLSRSSADTRTTSDAATQTGTRPRTAADTRTTTDAATRLLVLQRSAADTRTTSDAATRTLVLVRSAADTRTTTDAATRLLALARSASDAPTTSDAATRTVVLFRTAADNPTLSDTAVVESGNDRFLADTPTTSDTATRTLVLARSAADTRTTSDAATQTGSRSRTAADTRTTSDAATRTLALARSAIDDRITSDTASRTLTLARAAVDNPTLSDSAARYVTTIRIIHGQADLADSAVRTIGLQRTVADNPTFSDTATVSVHLSRAAIDGVAFSDEAAAALADIIGTDTISFSDIAEITIVRGGQPISKRRADGGYVLVPYGKLPDEEREPKRRPERKPVHYMVAAFDGFGITDAASSSTIQSEDWLFDLDEESLILLT